jgi:hypothetical protein
MASGKYFPSTQAETAYVEDELSRWLRHVGLPSMFLISTGMIGQLRRDDEEPRAGDVLAMMKGVRKPFLLCPNSTPAQREYEFVGACGILMELRRSRR